MSAPVSKFSPPHGAAAAASSHPEQDRPLDSLVRDVESVAQSRTPALPENVFARAEWEKFFGDLEDVAELPTLPNNISEFLAKKA